MSEDRGGVVCWGGAINGGDVSKCTPGFVSGKAHFKVKSPNVCAPPLP